MYICTIIDDVASVDHPFSHVTACWSLPGPHLYTQITKGSQTRDVPHGRECPLAWLPAHASV